MGRLERQFGKFGTERCTLLWREVSEFSNEWFSQVIDEFIGTLRQMPLLTEFRDQISLERERLRRIEKAKERQDARDFWEGTYHPEEVKNIAETIRKRLQGQVTEDEFSQFLRMLDYGASAKVVPLVKCKTCEDQGYVFEKDRTGFEWTYRCRCVEGQKKGPAIPTWTGKLK